CRRTSPLPPLPLHDALPILGACCRRDWPGPGDRRHARRDGASGQGAARRARRAQTPSGGSRGAARLHRAAPRQGAGRPAARAAALPGMEDILTVILIFGGGASIARAFSPIGRAGADRSRVESASAGGGGPRTDLAEPAAPP